ncbi:MAG: hypothetical protein ABIR18_03735 [Chitinophagaceae bacterium]
MALGLDILNGFHEEWKAEHVIQVGIDAVGIAIPVFGMIYFLADLGTQAATGKSISQHLGDAWNSLPKGNGHEMDFQPSPAYFWDH